MITKNKVKEMMIVNGNTLIHEDSLFLEFNLRYSNNNDILVFEFNENEELINFYSNIKKAEKNSLYYYC